MSWLRQYGDMLCNSPLHRFPLKSVSMKENPEGVHTSLSGLFTAGKETQGRDPPCTGVPVPVFHQQSIPFCPDDCLNCFLLLAGIQNECEESDKGSDQCDTADAKSSNLENFLEFHFYFLLMKSFFLLLVWINFDDSEHHFFRMLYAAVSGALLYTRSFRVLWIASSVRLIPFCNCIFSAVQVYSVIRSRLIQLPYLGRKMSEVGTHHWRA